MLGSDVGENELFSRADPETDRSTLQRPDVETLKSYLALRVKVTDHYTRALTAHYAGFFGAAESLHWPHGPVQELPEGFRVLRSWSASSRLYTFATCGMAPDGEYCGIECFLLSPVADQSQVELLTVLAWYHLTRARLGVGHTVNFGRNWMPDSDCCFGLLSLPHLNGPPLERFNHKGCNVQVLWLIPITPQERAFKVVHGLEALESRFETSGFNYADPHRGSVVTSL